MFRNVSTSKPRHRPSKRRQHVAPEGGVAVAEVGEAAAEAQADQAGSGRSCRRCAGRLMSLVPPPCMKREPFTMSAPASGRPTKVAMSGGSIEPSASSITMMSPVAAAKPVCSAAPLPWRSSITTFASRVQLLDDVDGAVGRAAVDDHELVDQVGKRGQDVAEVVGLVQRRDDHADRRLDGGSRSATANLVRSVASNLDSVVRTTTLLTPRGSVWKCGYQSVRHDSRSGLGRNAAGRSRPGRPLTRTRVPYASRDEGPPHRRCRIHRIHHGDGARADRPYAGDPRFAARPVRRPSSTAGSSTPATSPTGRCCSACSRSIRISSAPSIWRRGSW